MQLDILRGLVRNKPTPMIASKVRNEFVTNEKNAKKTLKGIMIHLFQFTHLNFKLKIFIQVHIAAELK